MTSSPDSTLSPNSSRISERTLAVLEWNHLTRELAARARTPFGKLRCAQMLPGGLALDEAASRARAALELVDLKRQHEWILPLGDIPDLGRQFLRRISRSGSISLGEFADLVRFHKAAQGLHHFLNRYANEYADLQRNLRGIDLLEKWSREQFPLLDAQSEMSDSASEDLRALRKLSRDLVERIRTKLEDFLHNPRLAELMQDFYVTVRDGRYVIPIKTNFRGRVPGIIHDVSNTEATLFIEPQEIVEWNNQLKVTEKEIEREIEKILAEVVEHTRPVVSVLENNFALLQLADQLSAAAQLTEDWHGPSAVATTGAEVSFTGLRHPMLSLANKVVANSFGWPGALVLTGPNTGGKTVLLKSAGLAYCLARSGLPIPAEAATLPEDLGAVAADIGDDQNLEANLSTFSGHLLVLREMIEGSQPGDLLLIDEICTGTSPEEGQPLAQAVIEALLDKNMRVFVTTHYGALKQFAMNDARCRIAAMAFDSETRRPTYEILLDIPGSSSAFETAEQLGLPAEILRRARRLQGEVSEDTTQAVARLEQARRRFVARELELAASESKARAREEKAQAKILESDQRQRQGLSEEAREILRSLIGVREELALAVKNASVEELKAGATPVFTKISDFGEHVRELVQDSLKGEVGTLLRDEDVVVDAVVEIEGVGIGTVVEVPRGGGADARAQVTVQVGDLKTRVARSRLRRPGRERGQNFQAARQATSAAQQRRTQQVQSTPGIARGVRASGSVICDVRGKGVEDALRRIEGALNEIARDENAIVTIIHGHGSERLKESIRDYLEQKRSDVKFRSGSWPGEGGDGVTVVERNR